MIIIFFLQAFSSFAQTQTIHSIPEFGFLFDKGWKFQAGDNMEYAKPDFDDRKWQSINPVLDIHELPQIKQGIVWFRLHFFIDSNLLKEQLVLVIEQSGASEIYLNGSLIYTIGVFNTDPAKLKAYDPSGRFTALPVKNTGQQILSVRYALQPGIRYNTIFETTNYAFKAGINTLDAANRNVRQFMFFLRGIGFFINGILFIFAILHFCFFLFYRAQKANLYFSLFAFLDMVGFFIFFSYEYLPWVDHKFYVYNLAAEFLTVSGIFMFTALYYLFEQKRNWWYFTLVSLNVICIIAFALPGYWGWDVGSKFTVLMNLEITRISFIAVKKKKRGAWIIAVGCVCLLVCWMAFITRGPGTQDALIGFVYITSLISIPLSISIYLGVDFAFTNRQLQEKLIEVNELSQKTIAQEKEKQQLLATQNETLEQKVTERTTALNNSLQELKSTQAQLIQSEKMASLGELTAGIAHEIQNPLNFVNNFSEVNKELLFEMKDEMDKGNIDDAKAIANDVIDNEEKINHHGKRADAIVKGMLQHS
ncbi:MAG: 7TM diverse intracellular signaling domain-containing protein, partial [Ferruginibacter sp.]